MDLKYLSLLWENVRAGLIATIDEFEDSELDYRPFPTSWSARQIMLHIAQEEDGEFNFGIAQTLNDFPPEYPPERYPDRESIKSVLATVHSPVKRYLVGLDQADLGIEIVAPWGTRFRLVEMISHMIEHEVHHRGELSLILGMLGKQGLNA